MATIHGNRTRGSTAKLTHNCCIFGIMGGTAPLTGVPLAHRAYLEKRATRKALCIQDCAKGHKYLKDNQILGCNPQAGGVGNMWRHRHYSSRWGATPPGDSSAHGSRGSDASALGNNCCNIVNALKLKIKSEGSTLTYTLLPQDDPVFLQAKAAEDLHFNTLDKLWMPSTIVPAANNTIYGLLEGPGAHILSQIDYLAPSTFDPGFSFTELARDAVNPNQCGIQNMPFGDVTPICQ